MGSPFYMAPEQWSDEEPDARADIYSIGIILYQMLAGEVPFKGSSIPSIMKKHLTLPPPSLQSFGVTVPPPIEAVVRHALEKEVSDRIDSIESFLKELRGAMTSSPVIVTTARPTGALDPNKTMVSDTTPVASNTKSPGFSTAVQPPVSGDTNFAASFESMPGTVNLDVDTSQKVADRATELRREREQQEAALQRAKEEAEEKRRAEEERQRLEREERLRKEHEERAAREREQQEKFEKMALQAQELEQRLEKLSVSMPPSTTVDPEATHVREAVVTSLGGYSPSQAPTIVNEAPQGNSTMILAIIAVVVVLGLAGVGIGGYLLWRTKKTPVVVNQPPIEQPTPYKPELVKIDGGTFEMGRNVGPPQQRPAHAIQVQSFFMDKTEVTNQEYGEFVRETNHPAPGYFSGQKPPFGQERWPVVNVSQADASAFAAWRSKRDGVSYRLPTEEEWEYAARNGSKSNVYPWGDDWVVGNAVVKEGTPSAVGSHPKGVNKWGVEDLIGNVWEWTSSNVSSYPGNPVKISDAFRDRVAIRGGCYVSDPAVTAENPASSSMREFIPANTKTPLLGFRLVRSAN
jgi:iron(II)-dependent oxidoreductase